MSILQTLSYYDRTNKTDREQRTDYAHPHDGVVTKRAVAQSFRASESDREQAAWPSEKTECGQETRTLCANPQVRVREWYHPIAEGLRQEAARAGKPLRLLIDGSQVGNGHQLLMVSLGYRRRALSLAWTWVRCRRGHSTGHKQCALLAYVHTLVPKGAEVVVLGDSEFSPLQATLEGWGWFYALRQKGSHLFRGSPDQAWQRCDTRLADQHRTDAASGPSLPLAGALANR